MMQDDAEEDTQFIDDDGDDDEESDAKSTSEDDGSNNSEVEAEEIRKRKVTTRTRREQGDELVAGLDEAKADTLSADRGWWSQFMKDPHDEEELMKLELGTKMVLLMDILKECYLIGDKVLVFSQSLMSLDLIQTFLDQASGADDGIYGAWRQGKDYFR
jgi:transcriptional regulator ATRX